MHEGIKAVMAFKVLNFLDKSMQSKEPQRLWPLGPLVTWSHVLMSVLYGWSLGLNHKINLGRTPKTQLGPARLRNLITIFWSGSRTNPAKSNIFYIEFSWNNQDIFTETCTYYLSFNTNNEISYRMSKRFRLQQYFHDSVVVQYWPTA